MIKYLSLLKSFKEEYILCDIAHMAAADGVFGGDLFCAAVSHTLSWVGYGVGLCYFLRLFLIHILLSCRLVIHLVVLFYGTALFPI